MESQQPSQQQQTPRAAQPAKRGFSVYAFLIVLIVIAIAAVAIQVARQRRGGLAWRDLGATPRGAMPRCLWPSDTAYVEGHVNVYPGFPGLAASCYSQPTGVTGAPMAASDAVTLLTSDSAAIAAACAPKDGPPALLWYQGSGSYGCQPKGSRAGSEGFEAGDAAFASQMPIGGADRRLRLIARRFKCHPGHVPVLTGGTLQAYLTPTSIQPCGQIAISHPTPMTSRNLRQLEERLSGGCGQHAGWYVVDAWGACPAALYRHKFYWADWAENVDRENFARDAGFEGYDQRRRRQMQRHDGFQAYGKYDPLGGLGGFGLHNPFSEFKDVDPLYDGPMLPREGEDFIGGAAPCVQADEGFRPGVDGGAARAEAEALSLMGASGGVYEGFSPDMPGACAQKHNRAARAEIEALRAAAGL